MCNTIGTCKSVYTSLNTFNSLQKLLLVAKEADNGRIDWENVSVINMPIYKYSSCVRLVQ
jgi:hypothetical protein